MRCGVDGRLQRRPGDSSRGGCSTCRRTPPAPPSGAWQRAPACFLAAPGDARPPPLLLPRRLVACAPLAASSPAASADPARLRPPEWHGNQLKNCPSACHPDRDGWWSCNMQELDTPWQRVLALQMQQGLLVAWRPQFQACTAPFLLHGDHNSFNT